MWSGLKRSSTSTWLYFTQQGIGLVCCKSVKSDTVIFKHHAWLAAEESLKVTDTLVSWVLKHSEGKLNFLLGEGFYQFLMVDVPEVPEDEMIAALKFKASELISEDIDDTTLDVVLMPEDVYRGRLRMAFLIAAEKAPLRQWAMQLAKQGRVVQRIDVDQLLLRNIAIKSQSQHQVGLLYVQANQCRLTLLYESEVVLARQFDIGHQSLDLPMSDTDDLSLEGEEADTFQLDTLQLELRRSFDYYESQLSLGVLAELFIIGWPEGDRLGVILSDRMDIRFQHIQVDNLASFSTSDQQLPENLLPLLGLMPPEGEQ